MRPILRGSREVRIQLNPGGKGEQEACPSEPPKGKARGQKDEGERAHPGVSVPHIPASSSLKFKAIPQKYVEVHQEVLSSVPKATHPSD